MLKCKCFYKILTPVWDAGALFFEHIITDFSARTVRIRREKKRTPGWKEV
jgi:hypothetical protein